MGTRMQMSVPDRLLIILVPRVSLPPTPWSEEEVDYLYPHHVIFLVVCPLKSLVADWPVDSHNRDLKQNTTATATRTSTNKSLNEQNNGYSRVLIVGTFLCRPLQNSNVE